MWSAVSYVNDGFSSVESIFRKLGISIGTLWRKMCRNGTIRNETEDLASNLERIPGCYGGH